jgi:hypothetical protein
MALAVVFLCAALCVQVTIATDTTHENAQDQQVCDRGGPPSQTCQQWPYQKQTQVSEWTAMVPDNELRNPQIAPAAVPAYVEQVPIEAFAYTDPETQLMFHPRFPDLGSLPVFVPFATLVIVANNDTRTDVQLHSVSCVPAENCVAWFESTEAMKPIDRFAAPRDIPTSGVELESKSQQRVRVIVLPTKTDHMACELTVESSRGVVSTRLFATGQRNALLPDSTKELLNTMLPWGKVAELPLTMHFTSDEQIGPKGRSNTSAVVHVDAVFISSNTPPFSIVRNKDPPPVGLQGSSAQFIPHVIASIRVRGATPGVYSTLVHVSGSFGLIVVPCSVTVFVGALAVTPPAVDFGRISIVPGDYDTGRRHISVDLTNYAQDAVAVLDTVLSPPLPPGHALTVTVSDKKVVPARGGMLAGALTVTLNVPPMSDGPLARMDWSYRLYEGTATLMTNITNPLRSRVVVPISVAIGSSALLPSPSPQVHLRLNVPSDKAESTPRRHLQQQMQETKNDTEPNNDESTTKSNNESMVSKHVYITNTLTTDIVIQRVALLEYEGAHVDAKSTPRSDVRDGVPFGDNKAGLAGCLSLAGVEGWVGLTIDAADTLTAPLTVRYNQSSPECIARGSLHAKIVIAAGIAPDPTQAKTSTRPSSLSFSSSPWPRAHDHVLSKFVLEIPILVYAGGVSVTTVRTNPKSMIRPVGRQAMKSSITCTGFPVSHGGGRSGGDEPDKAPEAAPEHEVQTECIEVDLGFVIDTANVSVMLGVRNNNPIQVHMSAAGLVNESSATDPGDGSDADAPSAVLVKWVETEGAADAALARTTDTTPAEPNKVCE